MRSTEDPGTWVFTALTAFAEAFGNPLAPVLVLCLALLLTNPWYLRSAAAALGCLAALPELAFATSVTAVALGLLGAMIAMVLYAEVMLHLVLPCLRFVWRCAQALWALTGLVARALLTALPESTTSSRIEPPDDSK